VSHTPSAIAVIVGRAGSKGLPGKNTLTLGKRPMIAYTIEAAIASRSNAPESNNRSIKRGAAT